MPPDVREKPLGLSSLLALGVNGIVGVGIFYAPAEVMALAPGLAGSLVYVVAALGLVPVALVFGQLGRQFAENGGPYVWARAAFGPLIAFAFGWLTYLSSLLSAAAVLSGLGAQLASSFGVQPQLGAFGCLVLLAANAACGLRLSAASFRVVTLLKLLPLVALLALGAWLIPVRGISLPTAGSFSLGRATLLVVFALQGFEVVPVLAGESSKPVHVQRATLWSLLVCAVLYALLQAVCAITLTGHTVEGSPLVQAAGLLAGQGARQLVLTGQLISALGIAFGQVVTTPHYLAALCNEQGLGKWLGARLENGVPLRALLVTAALLSLAIVQEQLASLLVLSSIAVLAQYGVAAASCLLLARSEKSPAVRRRNTFLALLALATSTALCSSATTRELLITLLVEAFGIALFMTVRAIRARRV